jgi:hypothetical protein
VMHKCLAGALPRPHEISDWGGNVSHHDKGKSAVLTDIQSGSPYETNCVVTWNLAETQFKSPPAVIGECIRSRNQV